MYNGIDTQISTTYYISYHLVYFDAMSAFTRVQREFFQPGRRSRGFPLGPHIRRCADHLGSALGIR